MSEALDKLLRETGIWRASMRGDQGIPPGLPSGYPGLDRQLPGGGWPRDGIAELLHDRRGIGELRLIAPALGSLSREDDRWIAWIAPPHIPYAPALAAHRIDLTRILVVHPRGPRDMLWTAEKALASTSCSAVLVWVDTIGDREIRRLQVAAREGHCWNVLFRPGSAARQSSPAELRVQLFAVPDTGTDHSAIRMQILKRRGGWATEPFQVTLGDELYRRSFPAEELILPRALQPRPGRTESPPGQRAAFPGSPRGIADTEGFLSREGDGTIRWH